MLNPSASPLAPARGHRVRELVCAYRPLRDGDGRVVDVPTVVLKDPRTAAAYAESAKIINELKAELDDLNLRYHKTRNDLWRTGEQFYAILNSRRWRLTSKLVRLIKR